MARKMTRVMLALFLAAWWLMVPRGLPASAAESFRDTGSHWSKQAVEKSYALGLMKGYPGDVFKPEDPVSRLEAIAIIVRAMGLEEEAKNLDWKNSGVKLPQGMSWGQGHLVLAAQKGLIHRDYVSLLLFNSPITRAEVATLAALALQDKLTIKGDPQKLSFSDTAKISSVYQQYVADVTQNNIMQGLENNRFGPDEPMKRGQMAALMVKTVQDRWFTYGAENIVTGPLGAVDGAAGILKITGDALRPVDPKAVIYKNSRPASLGDFRAGDTVLAITGDGGRVKYLESAEGALNPVIRDGIYSDLELTGKIVDRIQTGNSALKIRDSSQVDHLYAMDTAVIITDAAGARDPSYLADGQYVTLKVKNNAIQSIRLLPSEEVEGEVTGVLSGYFTIKTPSGGSRVFSVRASDLRIVKGGSQIPYSDLKTGDVIKVISVSGEAREIIFSEMVINTGQIRTVDVLYRMVAILDYDRNTRKEYEIEPYAPIKRGIELVPLDYLKQGDLVRARIGANGKITEITAASAGDQTLSGYVTDWRPGISPRIYVDRTVFDVSRSVSVTRQGYNLYMEDIIIGSYVTLRLNRENIVTGIEIINDKNIAVEGTVTEVSYSTDRIRIEQSSGLSFSFQVDAGCYLRDIVTSTTLSSLSDIRRGSNV